MPRPVLPRERGVVDRFIEYLIGDGPSNRFALVCRRCESHNGMALKEEFPYLGEQCWAHWAQFGLDSISLTVKLFECHQSRNPGNWAVRNLAHSCIIHGVFKKLFFSLSVCVLLLLERSAEAKAAATAPGLYARPRISPRVIRRGDQTWVKINKHG